MTLQFNHAWVSNSEERLYVMRVPDNPSVTDVAALGAALRRFMEAGDARIAWVTDLSELHHVGAVQRRMFFDDNRKVAHRLQARMMCIGVCAPRALQRGLVTAFSWFIPTPFPMRVFGDLDEALGWSRTQLAQAVPPR